MRYFASRNDEFDPFPGAGGVFAPVRINLFPLDWVKAQLSFLDRAGLTS